MQFQKTVCSPNESLFETCYSNKLAEGTSLFEKSMIGKQFEVPDAIATHTNIGCFSPEKLHLLKETLNRNPTIFICFCINISYRITLI